MSGFPDEFFSAPGAGDGNLALAPGDPHGLAALGAVEIPIVPVFKPVDQLQKFPVFLIALIGVSGKHPEHGPDHQRVAQQPEDQAYRLPPKQGGENAGHKARNQDCHIQTVGTVPAGHESAQGHSHSGPHPVQPAADSIHI